MLKFMNYSGKKYFDSSPFFLQIYSKYIISFNLLLKTQILLSDPQVAYRPNNAYSMRNVSRRLAATITTSATLYLLTASSSTDIVGTWGNPLRIVV